MGESASLRQPPVGDAWTEDRERVGFAKANAGPMAAMHTADLLVNPPLPRRNPRQSLLIASPLGYVPWMSFSAQFIDLSF
jgi:hypothetical protein